ncbi:Histone-lysine N-methyltransferase SETMAR, partial [Dufourea novaeangliae]
NPRRYCVKLTREHLEDLSGPLYPVPHPPYSPDIALLDFHLFRVLKRQLVVKNFHNYATLKNYIGDFPESKTRSSWEKGIQNLPSRCMNVIDNDGDYTGCLKNVLTSGNAGFLG